MKKPTTLACCAFVLVATVAPAKEISRLEEHAVEIGPGLTPPRGHGMLVMQTPDGVAESNAHATLQARLLIDKDGWVRLAEFLGGTDPLLAAAAMKMLKDVRFSPATRENEPLAVWWTRKISVRPRIELDAEVPSASCVPQTYDARMLDEEPTDDPDLEAPRLLERAEPVYPPELRPRHIEGDVTFRCVIDTCGHVRDCRVVGPVLDESTIAKGDTITRWRYTPAAFAKAGLNAAVHWRYAPARRNGVPVTMAFKLAMAFRAR
jgi:hypothetical protein